MRLVLRGITKRFGATVASDGISLTVEPGEIHCLLGENGAGKSTLMNVLYGLYQPDAGEVCFEGQAVKVKTTAGAPAPGVWMVHQHFTHVPPAIAAALVASGN
mgnify:CR=1 FL=1